MFNVGDMVDVVYTRDMANHGISLDIISSTIRDNPHEVRMRNGISRPSYYLHGSSKIWPFWMIVSTLPREPDWEI